MCKPARVFFVVVPYSLYQILWPMDKWTSLASQYRSVLILVCQSRWRGNPGRRRTELEGIQQSSGELLISQRKSVLACYHHLRVKLGWGRSWADLLSHSAVKRRGCIYIQPTGVHLSLQTTTTRSPTNTQGLTSPNFLILKIPVFLSLVLCGTFCFTKTLASQLRSMVGLS